MATSTTASEGEAWTGAGAWVMAGVANSVHATPKRTDDFCSRYIENSILVVRTNVTNDADAYCRCDR